MFIFVFYSCLSFFNVFIDLTLIGATAIEDKLQDGVPEAIGKKKHKQTNMNELKTNKHELKWWIYRT